MKQGYLNGNPFMKFSKATIEYLKISDGTNTDSKYRWYIVFYAVLERIPPPISLFLDIQKLILTLSMVNNTSTVTNNT